MKKRALVNPNPQSMIALLIFIITISLIVYILFLPPSDRADLLEQNRTNANGQIIKNRVTVLMTKEPGRLSNIADDEIIKDMPSFSLFTRTDAKSLVDYDSIYISKSLFEEQNRNITFAIGDFEDTNNYILSFSAPKRNGILTISLNGNVIMASELSTSSPSPIKLPKDLLKQNNNLVFSVSGPGLEFWKSNIYGLENIKITADITDRSSQDNTQMIFISEQEIDNLESFELRFVADCRTPDVGPLEIYLRKRKIFDSVPDCGGIVDVPTIDAQRLIQGENDLIFKTEKGNFLLYNIEVKLKLKEPIFPTYFFNLNEDTYAKIQKDESDLNVSLLFPNSIDRKKGVVLINDYIMEIETYEAEYSRNIDSLIRKGNNAIEIRPKSDKLDILELNILIAE